MNKRGAEGDFKNMLFGFILIALFGMLILTAVVQVSNNYNKDATTVVGGSLSINKFNNSIKDVEKDAEALNERFQKGSIWSAVAGVVVEGIFGVAKDMITMILLPFDILADIMSDVLGVPTFVTAIILALVIFAGIFGIWRLLKIGE